MLRCVLYYRFWYSIIFFNFRIVVCCPLYHLDVFSIYRSWTSVCHGDSSCRQHNASTVSARECPYRSLECWSLWWVLLFHNISGQWQVSAFFVPHPFWRKEGGLWNGLLPLLRPSVCLAKSCGCHNSATTGSVHSTLSWFESSWPVHVQHHGHFPIGDTWVCLWA